MSASCSEPPQKRAREEEEEEEEISAEIKIIKDSILNGIYKDIPEDIATEIAKLTGDKYIDCEHCGDDDIDLNDVMNTYCEQCKIIYCKWCKIDNVCNNGKHCLNCVSKEFIISCYECQSNGETQFEFIPKLCLKCDPNGKHKENTYLCNVCGDYQCDLCYHSCGKTRSFWECCHDGCYETICIDCSPLKKKWSFCDCDQSWCPKHTGLCCNCN